MPNFRDMARAMAAQGMTGVTAPGGAAPQDSPAEAGAELPEAAGSDSASALSSLEAAADGLGPDAATQARQHIAALRELFEGSAAPEAAPELPPEPPVEEA